MEYWNLVILVGAALLLASIVVSVISNRVGIPLLLIFLVLGMLAGEDGPGGIQFSDFEVAYLIGTLALAVIIFDGGLRTRTDRFRVALWPAVSLAVVGVAATAAMLGVFAAWLFGLSWLEGLLLGALISSTDAAAVFSTLRSQGANLKQRVAATLEIESGSNDPMAILLTVVLLDLIAAGADRLEPVQLLTALLSQFVIGGLIGYVGGRALGWIINRLDLISGLYPLLALAGGIVIFALATTSGGSGFLAIYLAGVVLGNMRLRSRQNILRVNDGLAWLSQIAMFLMLGLLVTPTDLIETAWQGLAVAMFLMLVARPLAVVLSLTPFLFPWRDQAYIGWMGLRGAVPIVLATFPVMYGLENAAFYFNIAFFVVLISLIFQGMTVSGAARVLGIEAPAPMHPTQRTTLNVPGNYEFEWLSFAVKDGSYVVGRRICDLLLPESTHLSAVLRDGQPLDDDETERLMPGDYCYFISKPASIDALAALFDPHNVPVRLSDKRFFGEFTLNGDVLLDEIAQVYGIELPRGAQGMTIDQFMSKAFHKRAVVGDVVAIGSAELVVREIEKGAIHRVGLRLPKP